MHHVSRRLSPSLLIAIAALFVALAGSAVAATAVIITSPDQLGPDVVTGPAIAQNAISSTEVQPDSLTDLDFKDPQLKVRVLGDGAVLSGSDGTAKRVGVGTYQVTFDAIALNAKTSTVVDTMLNNNCAFTATPRGKLSWITVLGPVA